MELLLGLFLYSFSVKVCLPHAPSTYTINVLSLEYVKEANQGPGLGQQQAYV